MTPQMQLYYHLNNLGYCGGLMFGTHGFSLRKFLSAELLYSSDEGLSPDEGLKLAFLALDLPKDETTQNLLAQLKASA